MSLTHDGTAAVNAIELEPSPEAATARTQNKAVKRAVVLLAVLGVLIAASYVLPIRTWLHDAGRVSAAVRSLGAWVYPVGILTFAALVACGVPRLLLCTVAAAALGFWGGFLLGEAGTVVGYYGVFLFIRWGGRQWALHRWPKLHKWSDGIRERGWLGVILLRQLPIHGMLINLSLGISRIRHRDFLFGTALGILPESIPMLLVGAGIQKGSPGAMGKYIALALVAFVLIWLGCAYAMRRRAPSKQNQPPIP